VRRRESRAKKRKLATLSSLLRSPLCSLLSCATPHVAVSFESAGQVELRIREYDYALHV
jgi:hypothetical protein